MTSFSGSPEMIAQMMGLPEENWFNRLDRSHDWSSLVLEPVGDLAETEKVFRTLWSHAQEIVLSKPRSFFAEALDGPEAATACDALRAIGATRLAEMIEDTEPEECVFQMDTLAGMPREDAQRALIEAEKRKSDARNWRLELISAKGEVRDLLIEFLRKRGVFPLEKITPRRISRDDLRREFGLPESDWFLILAGAPGWRAAGIPHVEGLDLARIERTFRAVWALGKGDFPRVFPLDPADPRLPAARDALVAIGAHNFVVFIDKGLSEADMDRARHMPSKIPAEPGRTHEENLQAVLTHVKVAARDFDALQSERVRIGRHLADYLHACGVFPLNTDWSGPIYDRDTLDAHIARRRAGLP